MPSSNMEDACTILGKVSTNVARNEGINQEELCAFKLALKELQSLLEGISGGEDRGVLARVLVVAAGHFGQHYWTNAENRRLANG